MKIGTRGLGLVFALTAMMAGGDLHAQDATFAWSQSMRAGQLLEVKGIVGEIRVEVASGDRAEVRAEKQGRSRDFEDVEIRVEEHRDGYTICAVYHPDEARGSGCDVEHGGEGRGRRRSLDVEVEYVVRLPAGVEFHGAMVSGDIMARDLRSDIRANTVDGDIFVSTTEQATANTVSGSIEVEMGATDWEDLSFRTVSGDITLWLPERIATDVDFSSLSGDIDSDFPVTSTKRRTRRFIGAELEGYIGERGERSLSFNTVSGDVRLRRAR